MANITLTIDDELLIKARQRAARENTSVNAIVREHLANYARAGDEDRARDLIRLMDDIVAKDRPSSGGKKWTREEIYDREVLLRHQRPGLPVRHKRKP
ncbi:MAG: hypothetical protein ABJB01_10900 [Rudaea sp.]